MTDLLSPLLYKSNQDKIQYHFSVSKFSQIEICPIRARLAVIHHVKSDSPNAASQGTKLHNIMTFVPDNLDREILNNKMKGYLFGRTIDDVQLKGRFDDLYVTSGKIVHLCELRTTTMKYLPSKFIEAKVFQLMCYMWIYEPAIVQLGYKLGEGYVGVYSQQTGELLKKVTVEPNPNIEKDILHRRDILLGLNREQLPPESYCLHCGKEYKIKCWRWNN